MKLVVRGTPLINGVATITEVLYGSCVPKRSDELGDCESPRLSAAPPRLVGDVVPPAPPPATLTATGDTRGEGSGAATSEWCTWSTLRLKLAAFLALLLPCGAAEMGGGIGTLWLVGIVVGAALAADAATSATDDGDAAELRALCEGDDGGDEEERVLAAEFA